MVFAVIPLCRNVRVLASVMALAGLAMGCIDTVANMQLVRIYQKDSAVFLQVSPQAALPLAPGPSPKAGYLFPSARVVTQKERQGVSPT